MQRDEILKLSSELINGQRAKEYGDSRVNHQRIADGWNVIINSAHEHGDKIEPSHVALMMAWVKISRLCNTLDHEDSWVDLASYAALGGEMSEDDPPTK